MSTWLGLIISLTNNNINCISIKLIFSGDALVTFRGPKYMLLKSGIMKYLCLPLNLYYFMPNAPVINRKFTFKYTLTMTKITFF